jgi:hypothetical protein
LLSQGPQNRFVNFGSIDLNGEIVSLVQRNLRTDRRAPSVPIALGRKNFIGSTVPRTLGNPGVAVATSKMNSANLQPAAHTCPAASRDDAASAC